MSAEGNRQKTTHRIPVDRTHHHDGRGGWLVIELESERVLFLCRSSDSGVALRWLTHTTATHRTHSHITLATHSLILSPSSFHRLERCSRSGSTQVVLSSESTEHRTGCEWQRYIQCQTHHWLEYHRRWLRCECESGLHCRWARHVLVRRR